MKGLIESYRRGLGTIHMNQAIITIKGIDSKSKAASLMGKTVVYKTKNGQIKGTILASHGGKGSVRVRFERGLPGQAMGEFADIR